MDRIVIVGAGPAGLGASLAFHAAGFSNIHIYESRDCLESSAEDSYPIGLNRRGQRCLGELCPTTLSPTEISKFGLVINSWKVLVGPGISVANYKSGKVLGTTRTAVTKSLLAEIEARGAATIHFGYKATALDPLTREVTFLKDGETQVVVSCKYLAIADGFRSSLRDCYAAANPSKLQCKLFPWNQTFRVLFSDPNPQDCPLDPSVHYIMNETYVSKIQDGRWTIGICVRDEDVAKNGFLLSNDCSAENVGRLREYLNKKAPEASKLISDDECQRFFSRRTFTGSIAWVSSLAVGEEWAFLMGDAAHAVYPATGEGINASLEDALFLQRALQQHSDAPITAYAAARIDDANALSEHAYGYCKGGWKGRLQQVAIKVFKRFLGPTKEDLLYGELSDSPITYSAAVRKWKEQSKWFGGAPSLAPTVRETA